MKKQIIHCPYCNAEYLPGEIFIPKHFLGQPTYVDRDYTGKIVEAEGLEQCLVEEYTCDKCNSTFRVKATINYLTEQLFENKSTYTQKL